MTELSKYIGPDLDVPAGDIGVGAREIGYLYGQYKRLKGAQRGVLTGKGLSYGGSLARTEATGYGLIYYTDELLKANGETLADKRAVISGAGNVAIHAAEKAEALGVKVLTVSDSSGYVVDENGIDVAVVKQIKEVERGRIKAYADRVAGAEYHEGSVWDATDLKFDLALPCATQNEIDGQQAARFKAAGVIAVAEGANMPSNPDAIAANAGGVAVSALEMGQNSRRESDSFEKVDSQLHEIMQHIFKASDDAADEYGVPGNYEAGANIAGFLKVADAMYAQGM